LQIVHRLFQLCKCASLAALLLTAAVSIIGCGSGSTKCIANCIVTPPVSSTVTLAAPQSPLIKGQDTTFTVSVNPSDATGTVSIFDNTAIGLLANPTPIATGTLNQGRVTITLKPPYAGTRLYVAQYSGDSANLGSSGNLQIPVIVPPSAASCGLGTASYIAGQQAAPSSSLFTSTMADDSAICAQGSGTELTLNAATITKSGVDSTPLGNFADNDDPSGIDAAVLAYGNSATTASGASITLTGPTSIVTNIATYAAFASGLGSSIDIAQANIKATNTSAVLGAGNNGQLSIADAQITTDSSPLAIFDGGTLQLTDTAITATTNNGVVILYSENSATPVQVSFSMTGGSLSRILDPTASYDTVFASFGNQEISIYLSNVDLSGLNLKAADQVIHRSASQSHAQTLSSQVHSNDLAPETPFGTVYFTLDDQALTSTLSGDSTSSLTLKNGSTLDGDFLGQGDVSIDATSSWTIHSSFVLDKFNDAGGISGDQVLNITGNGQTIGYSNAANPQLGGKTYNLQGGGTLVPY